MANGVVRSRLKPQALAKTGLQPAPLDQLVGALIERVARGRW
ncbi:MAG: hypothetical protein NZM03_03230 [Limisphaera sp.]|nr:hypothetical protein [Limisphaera sp.]